MVRKGGCKLKIMLLRLLNYLTNHPGANHDFLKNKLHHLSRILLFENTPGPQTLCHACPCLATGPPCTFSAGQHGPSSPESREVYVLQKYFLQKRKN